MVFKFDEENLGLTQEQVDHCVNKIGEVEKNLVDFFNSLEPNQPLSFGKILKVVCSSNLTKEELEFMTTSMIFNDIINHDNQQNDQTQQLLDLINQLSEKEDNDAV